MQGETYEEFVAKFKPKLTTDDCYTPVPVYEAVAGYVAEHYGIDRSRFVRPFYPGGDYARCDYAPGAVVVDNPPFSILTKICRFYRERDIPFFLFAPTLTILNPVNAASGTCAIINCVSITYENGAVVDTSFVTSLEPGYVIRTAPELYRRVKAADAANRKDARPTRELPKYDYPPELITAAMARCYARRGIQYDVRTEDAFFVRRLDSQTALKKTIYGGGYLLSQKAAAEKAAAEKAAAEKAAAENGYTGNGAAHVWPLSEREREIVRNLGHGQT